MRKIVKIDEALCTGCGLCADACHEKAIEIKDGKARLIRDDYCDGLGACLPSCPAGAISIEEREAADFDEAAVKARIMASSAPEHECPGSMQRAQGASEESELSHWPVQMRLISESAKVFDKADLLIAADCTAFARKDFHDRFMKDRVTVIGCPKLDPVDYAVKLTEILKHNDIKSVSVVRMQVPCCGGIAAAAERAVEASGKDIDVDVTILSIDGEVL